MARKSKAYSNINPQGFFGKSSKTRKTIKVFLVKENKSTSRRNTVRAWPEANEVTCIIAENCNIIFVGHLETLSFL